MKNIKKLVTAVMLGTMIISVSACGIAEKTPAAKAKQVVAKVGEKKITRGEVDTAMQSYIDEAKAKYGEKYETSKEAMKSINAQREAQLKNMVDTELMLQYIEDNNLEINMDEINSETDKEIEKMKTDYGQGDEQKYIDVLKNAGFTPESFKEYTKNRKLTDKAKEAIGKDITVSDEELATSFNEETFKTEKANIKHVQYILIKNDANEDKAKNKEIADAALAEIKGGLSFADAAKKYSEDSSTSQTGGYLGEVTDQSQLVEGFLKAALALNPGQVSEIIDEPTYGFFIIKALPIEEAIPFEKEKSKASLLQEKQSSKYTEVLEQLRSDKVKEYKSNLTN
ncbi:SurA N-terminal domain-containing protein [Clostridium cellulovorans]|uniref:peptidylprolyl isomerase n=1 Tax=Clostridium cellulovorans (strain ATCC 35296 / DSM 3052 / OCM 3 / 743B) TaxID=573061 RepID=D9SKP9_CLOC7|nr:SurA N-terminal domain-containing protein [Clostridium cellulovorans]ADL53471.1 PpiC-type peptidyl-prolyl cis-trans isomerase [Clostridium cellulovorans 743B]